MFPMDGCACHTNDCGIFFKISCLPREPHSLKYLGYYIKALVLLKITKAVSVCLWTSVTIRPVLHILQQTIQDVIELTHCEVTL